MQACIHDKNSDGHVIFRTTIETDGSKRIDSSAFHASEVSVEYDSKFERQFFNGIQRFLNFQETVNEKRSGRVPVRRFPWYTIRVQIAEPQN